MLRRPGYGKNDVRIQRNLYLAISGTASTTLDTVRLSIRAPPSLFLSAHQPMLSIWVPINDWDNVGTWTVVEALQYAAHSLLRPRDPTETLSGQMFVKILVSLTISSAGCTHINGQVNSQVQELRRLMDAMPIAVWDLQATPVPLHAPRSLRWSSDQDPAYVGPPGEVFHHRTPGTNQEVFTFEIQRPAWFVFQYTLNAGNANLNPDQLHDLVKDMIYIN